MEIAEIKSRLDIRQVLEHYGLKADGNGKLCCPFHDDKTPSMQVYEKTDTAYCFSANCKTHGHSLDVIDFIMHKEKLNKHQALLRASHLLGSPTIKTEAINSRATFYEAFFRFCENSIKTTQKPKAYMQSRGLQQATPQQTGIEIGYNRGTYHVSYKEVIADALHYGLLKANDTKVGGHHVFGKGCLVFPLKNASDQIVSLYFRSTIDDVANKHFYSRDRMGLYPHYPKPTAQKLILTESIIDSASLQLWQQELPSLALYGTNGLSEEHLKALKDWAAEGKEIILFFDGDAAGRKALELHSSTLHELLPKVKLSYVNTPENEDINSLWTSQGASILQSLLQDRQPFLFSIESHSIEKKEVIKLSNYLDTRNANNLLYKGIAGAYSIKGGIKGGLDSLKVSLHLEANGADYRSKIDLYEYKQIQGFCEPAAMRLAGRADEIAKDLTHLAGLLETYRQEKPEQEKDSSTIAIANSGECLAFLKAPKLCQQLNELIGKTGVVGEESNRLLLFFIASSYKMPQPLHALVQGSSGSGKTHLLLQIARMMPPEDTITLTRVTESSFYNYGENDLSHKLLCMEDLDGMKEEAFLAFRELQSRGMLTSSTSVKDEQGNIKGMVKVVRGPVATLSATTKGEIYEDNMSRSFLVAVDETPAQTERIIHYQNEVSAGLINKKEQKRLASFAQDCIRLLRPYEVVNPYARQIQLPPQAHKIRRLNGLYQTFVGQITLLNQYQRKKDPSGRLIATKSDLQDACNILFDSIVLKVDELDGSLRLFFEDLKNYVKTKGKSYEFTRREVREVLKISKTQQHSHMSRLEEMEYIRQSGGHINRGLHYKIVHWDSYEAIRSQIKEHLEQQLSHIS